MIDEIEHPSPHQNEKYRKRLLIGAKTIQNIKKTGYDPEEALQYFTQLIKEKNEIENKLKNNEETIKNTLDTITKISAAYHAETIKNTRLRAAIVALNPDNYWQILQKAEKGAYTQ